MSFFLQKNRSSKCDDFFVLQAAQEGGSAEKVLQVAYVRTWEDVYAQEDSALEQYAADVNDAAEGA